MSGLWGGGGGYQLWADHLERWAAGGDGGGVGGAEFPAPPALAPEDLPTDSWERLLDRITTAVNRRLQDWADALTAALSAAPDEFSAGRALAQSREGLRQIRALAAHPALPADFRTRLSATLDQRTRQLQQDIEADVDRLAALGEDPRLIEARRRTVRDNRLTAVLDEPPLPPGAAAVPTGPAWAYDPAGGARRRVVRD